MSGTNVEEASPVPEYELEQYFPSGRDLSSEDRARLRDQHGYVRTYFMERPEDFRSLQRWLNQSRFGVTYDVYLTRTVRYSAIAGALALLFGVLGSVQLAGTGAVDSLASVVGLEPSTAFTGVVGFVLTGFLAATSAGGTFLARYYYPLVLVDGRRRAIDVQLPHAIVYMYALSYGGMNTFEVIKELSESDTVYGEVANEFDMVVRDVELFGNDLFTALRDARNLTPSDNLEQFLDDMLSVIDSGSDFSGFLEGEAESYMDEARQEQDEFLDTLSVLSEVFVVLFVAAPLFLIVTLMVISLLGGESLVPTFLLAYVVMPLAMLGFLVVVDVLSKPYAQNTGIVEIEDEEADDGGPPRTVVEHPTYDTYEERKRRDELRERLRHPVQYVRSRSPYLTLVASVPVTVLVSGLLVASGALPTSWAAITETPVRATMGLFVLPFLLLTVPLTLFYEGQRRRVGKISKRFPDTLNILSSANQMGIPLTDSLSLVARWSEGAMADELRKVRNDIEWNHDVERALLSFANRLEVPQVTRTMNLIAKGSKSSSDLSKIISIAAEDTRNRHQIETKRKSEMRAYTAIVVIGFLVYLAVIVLLDTSYLQPIGQMSQDAARQADADLITVTEVPVTAYQTVFFHSALIQGIGSGLLAGKLAENDVLAGLKYSIVLVALTLAVFLFI